MEFNFLLYELLRSKEEGGGYTDNIVSLFTSTIKMGNRLDGGGDGLGKEPFWLLSMRRSILATTDLHKLAKKGKRLLENDPGSEFDITVTNIARTLRDTPTGHGHYERFLRMSPATTFEQHASLQTWAKQSYMVYCLCWASAYIHKTELGLEGELARIGKLKEDQKHSYDQYERKLEEFESDQMTFEVVTAYFLSELPTLAEKTRSGVLEHYFAFAAPFRSGLLARHFSKGISPEILPEETFKGKVIVLNFPVKQYLQLGIFAQCIYKKIWQQAVERRPVDETTRPVFMWIDEAQNFVSQDDMDFQTTARESKACTVLITQNISNYYAAIGGQNAKAMVDSLLGNLATKIFHNNNDAVTNEWAAETISKDYRNSLTTGDSGNTIGEEYQYQFLPKDFTLLKTGGGINDGIVEAVVTVASREWSNGKNFLKVIFEQDLK